MEDWPWPRCPCHRASRGLDGARVAPSHRSVNPRPGAAGRRRLRGPLGPWWGTDDFLGLQRARGRVSMPNRHGPTALIQKRWGGTADPVDRRSPTNGADQSLSVTVAERTDGAPRDGSGRRGRSKKRVCARGNLSFYWSGSAKWWPPRLRGEKSGRDARAPKGGRNDDQRRC